jgi:hypothetical protein
LTPTGNDQEVFSVFQSDWFRGRHAAVYGTNGEIKLPDDPLDGLYPNQQFMDIVVQGPDPGAGEYEPPAALRTYPLAESTMGVLPLTFGHSLPDAQGNVKFFAQAEFSTSGSLIPLPAPKITSFKALDVEPNQTWTWQVTNLTHGDHPFHTHGFFFELIEWQFIDMVDPTNNVTFQPNVKRMFKDTIRLPPRLGAKGTSKTITRLRVRFDDSGREGQIEAMGEKATYQPNGDWTSGGWLAHCHILEHSGKGMLTFFEIKNPTNPFRLLGAFLPGNNGNASLTATGDLSPASDVTFNIVNARPNQTVFLAAGNIAANRPFLGGTLVPGVSPDGVTVLNAPLVGIVFILSADANGEASFSTNLWEAADPGTEMFWQVGFKDTGGQQGWAFSNALHFTRP